MNFFNQLAITIAGVAVFSPVISENSAKAATVTLGFDELSEFETISGDTFSDLGVVFDNDLIVFDGLGTQPQSLPHTTLNPNPFAGTISGFFTEAVDFVSVFAGDDGGKVDTLTLLGFDELDNLVASDTFTATAAKTLSISGSGITRFEINGTNGFAIDNFTFNKTGNTAAVPEPSVILGSLAVVGIGANKKRKAMAS